MLLSCSNQSKDIIKIRVSGSDTMVEMAQHWAEKFMKNYPKIRIYISGGGSGVGMAALINDTTDLANLSRPIKQREQLQLKQKKQVVKYWKVALDALSIYVHQSNPITELSIQQIKEIYTGKLNNWGELAGKNQSIIAYGRENSSGTYAFFQKKVLNQSDFAENIINLAGTGAVFNALSKDPNGIAYAGFGSMTAIRSLKIRTDNGMKVVQPNKETIRQQTYPLSRNLFIYTTQSILKSKPHILVYLNWILSQEGQKSVIKSGYFPVIQVQQL